MKGAGAWGGPSSRSFHPQHSPGTSVGCGSVVVFILLFRVASSNQPFGGGRGSRRMKKTRYCCRSLFVSNFLAPCLPSSLRKVAVICV